jgi:AraC-like DNA-binding protein
MAVVHEETRRAGADGAVRVDPDRGTSPDQSGRPHPMLRGLLEGDYRGFTGQFEAHQLVLPASASVPVLLKMVDSPYRPPAFLLGAHGRVSVQPGSCAESYLQLRMAPLGAYRLLGLPISELGGAIVDLEDVFGKPARRLLDTMREAPAWAHRFDLVDRFLRAAADRGPRPSPEVLRAQELLTGDRGVRVGQVAAEVGWSHKHLITRFTQQVGLTPKTVARLARFEQAVGQVRAGRIADWGRVAADAGYADQAHLIREFRAFCGSTPTGYVNRALGGGGDQRPR